MSHSCRRSGFAALLIAAATLACPQMPLAHDLSVSAGWSRAGTPTARTGAAFVTIKGGHDADELIGAESPQAEKVELHTHVNDNGVMRMREMDSIAIPSEQTVVLKPGGLHLMLFGLKSQLTEGGHFPMTLRFRHAAPVTVDIAVQAAASMGGHGGNAGGTHQGGHHHGAEGDHAGHGPAHGASPNGQ